MNWSYFVPGFLGLYHLGGYFYCPTTGTKKIISITYKREIDCVAAMATRDSGFRLHFSLLDLKNYPSLFIFSFLFVLSTSGIGFIIRISFLAF